MTHRFSAAKSIDVYRLVGISFDSDNAEISYGMINMIGDHMIP